MFILAQPPMRATKKVSHFIKKMQHMFLVGLYAAVVIFINLILGEEIGGKKH